MSPGIIISASDKERFLPRLVLRRSSKNPRGGSERLGSDTLKMRVGIAFANDDGGDGETIESAVSRRKAL